MFIVGGATYSESRSCYEISKKFNRDVILGSTELITPQSFISELARARDSRQNLNLTMDKVRSIPQAQPPPQQTGLPSRPSQGSPNIPASMRPAGAPQPQGTGPSRNGGVGGPRPIPGQKSAQPHMAHIPGHGPPPPTLHHKSSASKDSKEEKKEKKKKKFGMF